MANVTDSSSLLVVPSGWSDGVLGSLKPDDGSGDFTFSRGSDLSATRVNEDGYIEKGYENLLLQSNNFTDASAWSYNTDGDVILTSGQTGYDGNNNAWEAKNDGRGYFRQFVTYPNQVKTFSIYAKSGNQDSFAIYLVKDGGDPSVQCDLGLGTATVGDPDNIDAKITPVTGATGWYRISLTWLSASTGVDQIRIYVGSSLGDTVIIQDAMLNQGLSAYPYIETTNTTAKAATISEDQPRIDYASGNGAVLIEPSGTNILTHSEYLAAMSWNVVESEFFQWDDSVLNPLGEYGSTKINNSSVAPMLYTSSGGRNAGTKVSISMFVKSSISTNFLLGGQTSEQAIFNALTGTLISQGDDVNSAYSVDYGNGWKRFVVNYTFQNIFNNKILYPRFRWYGNPEYVYLWGMQIEVDSTSESSYIPTYGTTATRAKDTATLTKNVAATGTIYININADSAKTLTFLGGNVSVTQGVNKIALAYSPTALKISHNGSIVQNIARSLDTSSLTEIQLGHRNNFEQTTDSINQFLTLDSFLTDTELNELTA